jgi:excisionase family DNA binding protein
VGTRDNGSRLLLTVEESAEFLNVSKATVYRLLKKGVLEKTKVEGKRIWRVTIESLDAYETATNFTLAELAARLLRIERKVEHLLARGGQRDASTVKTVAVDFTDMQREMRKRHPELFQAN